MQKVPVKILREGAALPTYGTASSSAGADLRACLDAPAAAPGRTRPHPPIGIAMGIPEKAMLA